MSRAFYPLSIAIGAIGIVLSIPLLSMGSIADAQVDNQNPATTENNLQTSSGQDNAPPSSGNSSTMVSGILTTLLGGVIAGGAVSAITPMIGKIKSRLRMRGDSKNATSPKEVISSNNQSEEFAHNLVATHTIRDDQGRQSELNQENRVTTPQISADMSGSSSSQGSSKEKAPPPQYYQAPPPQYYQAPPPQYYQAPPPQYYQAPPPQYYQAPPPQYYQAPPPQYYQAPPPQYYQAPPPQYYQAPPQVQSAEIPQKSGEISQTTSTELADSDLSPALRSGIQHSSSFDSFPELDSMTPDEMKSLLRDIFKSLSRSGTKLGAIPLASESSGQSPSVTSTGAQESTFITSDGPSNDDRSRSSNYEQSNQSPATRVPEALAPSVLTGIQPATSAAESLAPQLQAIGEKAIVPNVGTNPTHLSGQTPKAAISSPAVMKLPTIGALHTKDPSASSIESLRIESSQEPEIHADVKPPSMSDKVGLPGIETAAVPDITSQAEALIAKTADDPTIGLPGVTAGSIDTSFKAAKDLLSVAKAEVPAYQIPKVEPSVHAREAPSVEIPSIKTPDGTIGIPRVELPNIDVPSMHNVDEPKMPSLDSESRASEIQWSQTPKVDHISGRTSWFRRIVNAAWRLFKREPI